MSKRIARRKRREAETRTRQSKRRPLIVACSLLLLSLSLGLMAQWKMLPGITRPPVQAQSGSFNANSPSKEYIYAGGRLVATEEPGASATPTPQPNAATFISQSVPSSMVAGLSY